MIELKHNFTKNQAMQAASYVAQTYDFELSSAGTNALVKVVDDQHAVNFAYSSKTVERAKAVDGAADWYVSFGISRRDINEHLHAWFDQPEKVWFEHDTIFELGRAVFVTDEELKWTKDQTFDAAVEQIDAGIAAVMEWADLAKIESQLYEPSGGRKPGIARCVVNDALNGTDRVWDAYLENNEKVLNAKQESVRNRRIGFNKHLHAFKAKHPNGIPR